MACVMKTIKTVLPPVSSHWVGDGFLVKPVFSNLAFTNELSPFLMFDYGSPNIFKPSSKRRGVGEHPHRGFETVTIAFQGEVEHGDSVGNRGIIGEGDVQWMTAGRGIIHEEYISEDFMKKGGTVEMAQLWVNLPSAFKMTAPKYQPIQSAEIPVVPLTEDSGTLRVIAGSFGETQGPATTFSPVNVWDMHINPNKNVEFSIQEGHNTILFVRNGSALFCGGDKAFSPSQTVLLSIAGSGVRIDTGDEGCDLLVLSGEPLNEPIANRGPFVMNTQDELRQAIVDFQTGKLGR